jgi:hypothetical protein
VDDRLPDVASPQEIPPVVLRTKVGECTYQAALPAFRHTLPMSLTNRLLFTPSWTFFAKYYYPLATRYFSGDDLVFINFGYEEAPPMGLPLEASDEPDRYFIQLYHRTATHISASAGQSRPKSRLR